MRAAPLLLLAACLAGVGAPGQGPPPPKPGETQAESPALDWDRDFDLILESRQGKEREGSAQRAKVAALEEELRRLRQEEAELKARREIFSGNLAGEEALQEMLRLEVSSPDRARALLDSKLAEVRDRISDTEVELGRARRRK